MKAKQLALTILATGSVGTLLLLGLERLAHALEAVPLRAVSLVVPFYLLFAAVAWKVIGRLQRFWKDRKTKTSAASSC